MVPFRGTRAPPPTRLMAHIYGTKNFYTAIIRGVAAYKMPESTELYWMCWLTFFGVFALFSTEFLVYRTVRPREAVFPLVTSSLGMIWMVVQREYYCPG